MDIKYILESPEQAVARHHKDSGIVLDLKIVRDHTAEVSRFRHSCREAKQDKQLCARQFKEAKGDSNAICTLKAQMQEISKNLDTLTASLKHAEQSLLQLFQPDEPDSESNTTANPDLPEQFRPHQHNPGVGFDTQEPVRIESVDDSFEAQWDQYVDNHPQASLYHRYGWRRVISKSFQHQSVYLAALNANDEIVGVLPLIWLNSRLFGSFAVSVPFFNYGGPLGDSALITARLLEHLHDLLKLYQWNHVEVRTTQPGYNLPCQSRKVSMIRRLPKNTDALDQEIGAKVRAQINQGARHHPEVRFGKSELIGDFFKVFSTNMRDLGTPVYDKAFFLNILSAFPDTSTLVSVRINNQPVAAAFLTSNRDMLEIPWASTLKKVNKLNINMWMYRQILGYAIDSGFRHFDFGRSSLDAGTYRFKKQWGALPVQHYWYYALPDGESLPELNPDNPKYKLLIAIWKKMPVRLSNLIGPHIVKYLP